MKSDLRRERVKLGHEITRPAGLRGSSGTYARTRGEKAAGGDEEEDN